MTTASTRLGLIHAVKQMTSLLSHEKKKTPLFLHKVVTKSAIVTVTLLFFSFLEFSLSPKVMTTAVRQTRFLSRRRLDSASVFKYDRDKKKAQGLWLRLNRLHAVV